jgi:hypothetical protein
MSGYRPYDFLSFVLPGGTLLFFAFYGWFGWPWPEPGGVALVGILAAAFIAGHAIAGISSWLEPLAWGRRPGAAPDPEWGMFSGSSVYSKNDKQVIEGELQSRYGDVDFRTGYNLAYSEVDKAGYGPMLETLNERIGFYRNMTTAAIFGCLIVVGYNIEGRHALPTRWWLPIATVGGFLFFGRYRRFWRRFGDRVIRAFRLISKSP